MSRQTPRKAWGSGRIAVLARLDTIRSELGQGFPLTVIYDRHKTAIGIGYPSFCKLIERYAGDANPAAALGREDGVNLAHRFSHAASVPGSSR
jgi:hypothetical protein